MLANGPLVVSLIMVAIWILRTITPKVSSKFAPLLAIVLGILTNAIGDGSLNVSPQSLIDGALMGLSAAGLWSATKFVHQKVGVKEQ